MKKEREIERHKQSCAKGVRRGWKGGLMRKGRDERVGDYVKKRPVI